MGLLADLQAFDWSHTYVHGRLGVVNSCAWLLLVSWRFQFDDTLELCLGVHGTDSAKAFAASKRITRMAFERIGTADTSCLPDEVDGILIDEHFVPPRSLLDLLLDLELYTRHLRASIEECLAIALPSR